MLRWQLFGRAQLISLAHPSQQSVWPVSGPYALALSYS